MSVDTSRATVEALASDLDRQNEYEPLGHDGWTAAATLRALLAERDALIHDIERAKESESALLAELEQARVDNYEQGQKAEQARCWTLAMDAYEVWWRRSVPTAYVPLQTLADRIGRPDPPLTIRAE